MQNAPEKKTPTVAVFAIDFDVMDNKRFNCFHFLAFTLKLFVCDADRPENGQEIEMRLQAR
jgi:hypothetical protein